MAGTMNIPTKTRRLSSNTLDVDRPASWISRIPFFSRSPSLYKNTRHVAIVLKEVPTGFEDKDTSDSDLDDHDFDDHDDVGPSPKVELDAIGGEDALSEGEEEGEDENKEGDEDIGDEKEEEEEDIDKNEDEDESEWEDEDNEDFLSFALSRDEPVEIEESPTTVLPNDEPVEDFLCAAPKAEQPIEEQEQEDFLAISLPEEKAEAADECGNEEEFDFLADLLFEEEESEAVSKDSGTECAIPNDVPQAIVQTEPTIAKSSVDSHVPVASSMKAQIPQPHAPLVAKKRKAAQYSTATAHVTPTHSAPVSPSQPKEVKKRKRVDEPPPPPKKRKTKAEQRLAREQTAEVAKKEAERLNTNTAVMSAVPSLRRFGWMNDSGTSSGTSTPSHSRGSTPVPSSSKATTPHSAISGLSIPTSKPSTIMSGPSARMSRPAERAQAPKSRSTKNVPPSSLNPFSANCSVSETSRPNVPTPRGTIPAARSVPSAVAPSSSIPLPFRPAAKVPASTSSATHQPRLPPNQPSYANARPSPHFFSGPAGHSLPPRAPAPAPMSASHLPSKPSKEVIDMSGSNPARRLGPAPTTMSRPYTETQRPTTKRKWDDDSEAGGRGPGSFKRRG